jgi:molybdate transport repressor ModE-like protein
LLKYALRRATDLDPRRLAALAAIGRCGSLAGAAAALHVTPSAISQQLAHLEHVAGLPLVDRSARGATLTAAGRALAGRAEAIARELAEAERDLAALSGRAAGRVRVAAFATVIRYLLVPALAVLTAEHPDVTATIVEAEGEPALRRLRHGDFDLVIAERDASLGVEARRQVAVVALHTDP